MKIRFFAEALEEVREAGQYYRDISNGLGEDFAVELNNTLRQILDHPRAWSKLFRGTRQRKLHRFPYLVVYREGTDELIIVAVAHVSRQRGYWRNRLD